jgi:hypothetical protein
MTSPTPGAPGAVESLTFPFRFDLPFALPAFAFGVRPATARVAVRYKRLDVRFGPWRLVTPLDNVQSAEVTGPYWWPKVVGPPRLSLSDGGLTFATNAREGVCISFVEPVPGLLPVDYPRHGALTVTVDDCASLAAVLSRQLVVDVTIDEASGSTSSDSVDVGE